MSHNKKENKKKVVSIVPTATFITDAYPNKDILYRCSNCGQLFDVYGNKERYCHRCGVRVNWNNVLLKLSEPFPKEDGCFKEWSFITTLNKMQRGKIKKDGYYDVSKRRWK